MKNAFQLIFMLCGYLLYSQTSTLRELCKLDQRMSQSSGILTLNEGASFWTQVDNNSPAEIYEISPDCKVLRTLKVLNNSKVDWEDIAHDDQGTIFIGDFGNNNNLRTNLKIFILQHVEQQTDSIRAEVINFRYANQTGFPPPAAFRNFDMEAMVWYNDSLHLFSKNRTDPFTGYTYQYSMPAIPGDYTLSPVDSFKTGDGPMVFFWITGAAVNRKDKQLVLLSHDKIWLFQHFEGSRFFGGTSRMISLPTHTQKEGICFTKDQTWHITDEYFSTLRIGGNLYEMKLDPVSDIVEEDEIHLEIHPNPVHDLLHIILPDDDNEIADINIYNYMGILCKKYGASKLKTIIPIEDLANGIYYVHAMSKKLKKKLIKKIVISK